MLQKTLHFLLTLVICFAASLAANCDDLISENSSIAFTVPAGELIGTTTYDLQTNYGVMRRSAYSPNGSILHMGWIFDNTFSDLCPVRGTGYNYKNLNTGIIDDMPELRIEPTMRTGWPSIGVTNLNRIYSISHENNGIVFTYKDAINAAWTEVEVGTVVGDVDARWPRAANSGEKIYTISSRISAYGGVQGGINIVRSLDNGDTWEATGPLEPDYSQSYYRIPADSYQIDATDDKIAVVVGGNLNELNIYTSTNDGNSFTKTNIVSNSNPTIQYINGSQGYTVEPYWGCDGGNSVIIDNNGLAHVVFSAYIQFNPADGDPAEAYGFFQYSASALFYWNENLSQPELIGESILYDNDGDGLLGNTLNSEDLIDYSARIAQPSLGIDANNNLFVSYSAIVDGDWQAPVVPVEVSYDGGLTITTIDIETEPNTILLRDVFLLKKPLNGNWEGPLNVTNSSTTEDTYASIPRDVIGDSIHIVYQSDLLSNAVFANFNSLDPILNNIGLATVAIADINNSNSPVDSEPYITYLIGSDYIYLAESCYTNGANIFEDYLIGLDYPEGELNNFTYTNTIDFDTPGVYTTEVTTTDSQGNVSDVVTMTVEIIADNEAPTITVDNSIEIQTGTTLPPLEYEVLDNADCNGLEVTVEGYDIIDTNLPGVYEVTITATDQAGNQTIEIVQVTVSLAGCTDVCFAEYNPDADMDDGSCATSLIGCTNPNAENYNPDTPANCEDNTLCSFLDGDADNVPDYLEDLNGNGDLTDDDTDMDGIPNYLDDDDDDDGILTIDEDTNGDGDPTNDDDDGDGIPNYLQKLINGIENELLNFINYQNPFDSHLIIKNNKAIIEAISIFNADSKLMFSKNNISKHIISIDSSTWQKGVYCIVLEIEGKTVSEKLLKL